MDLIDKARWECELNRRRKEEMKRREEAEKLCPTVINDDARYGGRDWGIAFSQD